MGEKIDSPTAGLVAQTAVTARRSSHSVAPRPDDAGPDENGSTSARDLAVRLLKTRAFLGAVFLAILIGYFAQELPGTFATFDNFRSVLEQQSLLLLLALGLTLVLLIGEFDLSFAATLGLAGAVAVLLMTRESFPWLLAALAALGAGGLIGVMNGVAVAYGRAPAFIVTLAIGSGATGIERLLTDDESIVAGLPSSYLNFTLDRVLGLPLATWLALVLVVVLAVALWLTTYGRRVHSTGMNPTAATLAGISVGKVRLSAFAILGLLAGLAGVYSASQAGGYFTEAGAGILLTPYSAVFLGAAIVGRGRFSMFATFYGVIFIALLERGLTMLDKPSAVIQVVQGVVLAAAVLIARQERRD